MASPKNFESQKAPPSFAIEERTLPLLFGCPPNVVTEHRRTLEQGRDWEKVARVVCWTLPAARQLAVTLGLAPDQWPELRFTTEETPPPQIFTFKVLPRKVANPHILLVTDGKAEFRLRVKRKDNFRAFMDVNATHVSADLYELHGNCPRYPGKF